MNYDVDVMLQSSGMFIRVYTNLTPYRSRYAVDVHCVRDDDADVIANWKFLMLLQLEM